ncbi:MAG: putative ATP-dependent helicase/nuclease, partial [Actinomycetota bacterium]
METVELDESQQRAVSAALAGSCVRILGGPGTGKTSVALAIVEALVASASESAVRIVTPSRGAATRIRDEIGLRVGVATRGPLARSISSLAFDIVSASNPSGFTPRLISGGQQDADIKELLAEEIEKGRGGYWPDNLPDDVRSLREFRTQLRDLLARARDAELIDESADKPLEKFVTLATTAKRPEWLAAATFVEAYLRNMRDSRPGQVDPTELLQRATALLTESPTAVRQTLVVDDAHDLTPSQWRFVTTWAEWRGPVVVLGDPKLATTGFRGGSAAFLRDGATPIDWAAPVTLTTFHRQSGAVMTILRNIAEAIGGPEVTIQ